MSTMDEGYKIKEEDIYNEKFQNALDTLIFVDKEDKIIEANKSAVKFYGYTYDELIGKSIGDLWHFNKGDKGRAKLSNVKDTGENFEAVHYKKDGSFVHVEVISMKTGIDDIVLYVIRDISERIEKENAMRRLAAIVEHSQDAIISTDLENIITSWNYGAERIYGYKEDEVVGKSILILVPHDRAEEAKKNIENTMGGIFLNNFETMRMAKDGHLVNVSLTVSAIKNDDGNVIGASMIARDITERVEKEKELSEKYEELTSIYEELAAEEEELRHNYKEMEALKEEAERANRAKSQFLANMSHEIRTPMNGIICITELLAETVLNEQQHEYIGMLKESSRMLMEIIDNLLDISKIESGKFKLNKETFNLKDTIEKIIKELWLVSQKKNIEIMYFIEPFINHELIGDSLRLSQVLINIVNNAIKFTERGHIFIRVSKVKNDENTIRLLFSVEDTGIGMSDETKERLFKVFSQGDDSYTKKYRGTGLGLAICKDIVNMMNGKIWVNSKENEGSTFYFTADFSIDDSALKSNYIENKANTASNTRDGADSKASTILIVDDNEINKKVASAFMKNKGYKVLCASNGREALYMLDGNKVDLILMDIQMPELNGFEATKIIRDTERYTNAHIPIIAMTAYAMSGDRQKCIDAGMDDYISKPLEANELYKKVESYLKRPV
ncbi:sensory/regulatory protein RpfC [Oxobacter pfennigii]|uniref:Circadian input-output histidine kinase CikA n=1 Tax=Oxobacter pfennigii TaxID=36849 RepID=A0A0P8WVU1_9CLOT|nr:PAS domain S-box protein [Oxobacter pfennigii]KPU42381.1 sensory/regulatory protein RpfC [Oxobacter pfennigii]